MIFPSILCTTVSMLCQAQGALPASGPIDAPTKTSAQTPTPVISFETTQHDFGKIPANKLVSFPFVLTNSGKAVLNIKEVKASCGCTSTLIGKQVLAPGESTRIEASFNPGSAQGIVRKSITVTSDDPANPIVVLHFQAEVLPEVLPDAPVLKLQNIRRSVPSKSVTVLPSADGKPIQVQEVRISNAPYLTATTRSEGNDLIVEVLLDGQKIAKDKTTGMDTLTLVTSDAQKPLKLIHVQWELKPMFEASPAAVAWAEPAGKALRTIVTLQHADKRPFRIVGVQSSNPMIQTKAIGKSSAALQKIEVSLPATAKAGNYPNERIVLSLDDPDQPEMILRVSAILR